VSARVQKSRSERTTRHDGAVDIYKSEESSHRENWVRQQVDECMKRDTSQRLVVHVVPRLARLTDNPTMPTVLNGICAHAGPATRAIPRHLVASSYTSAPPELATNPPATICVVCARVD